jgi:hypothetical protein
VLDRAAHVHLRQQGHAPAGTVAEFNLRCTAVLAKARHASNFSA